MIREYPAAQHRVSVLAVAEGDSGESQVAQYPSTATLRGFEAIRYIQPMTDIKRHHLTEAADGFRYVVTLTSDLYTEPLPATEMIRNELARLMGLTVPSAAVVAVSPELLT
jgi:hypothetical protein